MSYIITDDKHYKDIASAIRGKFKTDREYGTDEMANAIHMIPSSADGTDVPVGAIYQLNPDELGRPTEIKFINYKTDVAFPMISTFCKVPSVIRAIKFENCEFPNTVDAAFVYCTSLQTISLPNSITKISGRAFYECKNLQAINIPNGVIEIRYNAFEGCLNLQTINIPNSVTTIDNGIFNRCSNLKYVTIESGFNADGLNLSASDKYTAETIVSWLNALADRTGQATYKLIIGAANFAKVREQLAIATDKNWTIA